MRTKGLLSQGEYILLNTCIPLILTSKSINTAIWKVEHTKKSGIQPFEVTGYKGIGIKM